MRTQLLALFALFSLLFSCNGQSPEQVKTITPKEYAERLKQNSDAQILDVRTPEEFANGHLNYAQNIDWYEKEGFVREASKLDKSKPVFIYCAAGARSKKASDKLAEMGFQNVYDMQGGYVKWNADGFGDAESGSERTAGMSHKEYSDLIKSGKKVLVDFYAPWCEPCKKMAPYLTRMEKEQNDVKIVRLNADEHKTLMKEMKIDSLPTLILYVDGSQTWKHNGYISEEDLKKQL